MAYTTIDNSQEHFNTVLYTGNGGTNNITGVGHQPDWVWLKERTGAAHDHFLFDVANGVKRLLSTNDAGTLASADNDYLTSFNSDGFSLGSSDGMNQNSIIFTSWNWKANGSGASNTDGTINTTKTSANTTSKFSISTYSGTGSAATFGHGLGVAPDAVIVKNLAATEDWNVWIIATTPNIGLLNEDDAFYSPGAAGIVGATITSDVIGLSTSATANSSGVAYVAYCFASVQGFSKFGSYVGNGNVDGAFINTGFKPGWVLIKRSSAGGDQWQLSDSKRGVNGAIKTLYPDSAEVESSSDSIHFLSNGFKNRATSVARNGAGSTYIYMAFAESPFVSSSGVPTTAR